MVVKVTLAASLPYRPLRARKEKAERSYVRWLRNGCLVPLPAACISQRSGALGLSEVCRNWVWAGPWRGGTNYKDGYVLQAVVWVSATALEIKKLRPLNE